MVRLYNYHNKSSAKHLPVSNRFSNAWGLAALLNWFHHGLGLVLVGGFHILLLLFFIWSATRSLYVIRQNKRNVG